MHTVCRRVRGHDRPAPRSHLPSALIAFPLMNTFLTHSLSPNRAGCRLRPAEQARSVRRREPCAPCTAVRAAVHGARRRGEALPARVPLHAWLAQGGGCGGRRCGPSLPGRAAPYASPQGGSFRCHRQTDWRSMVLASLGAFRDSVLTTKCAAFPTTPN